MKITTICTNNFDTPESFNFQRDSEQPLIFSLIGDECRILKLQYKPNLISGPNLKIMFVKLTNETRPTSRFIKQTNMITIYNSSNILNRQTLSIDPLYAADFSEAKLEPKIVQICWPKFYALYERDIAAIVTHFGQCNLIELNTITRSYEKSLLSINDTILNMLFPTKRYDNFEGLNSVVENVTVTQCAWMKINHNFLLFSTIAGFLYIVQINSDFQVDLITKLKTDFYKINKIKVFEYLNSEQQISEGIIVSDINGRIGLHSFENGEINQKCIIWNKKDKMSCKQIDIELYPETNELVLTTTKGFHFLAIILSLNDWQILCAGNEYCKAQISNYEVVSKYTYIVSTMIGQIKLIQLFKTSSRRCTFKTTEIEHDLPIENYFLKGMVATQNKVGWIFILCPEKFYLLNRERFAPIQVICKLDLVNPLSALKEYSRKNGDSTNYIDCHEIIRLQILKNQTCEDLHSYDFKPIIIDWNFLHRLRIKYSILNSINGYSCNKIKSYNRECEIQLNYITFIIRAIFAYWRLLRIKKDIRVLSDFQKLTAKCLLKILIHFFKIKIPENSTYAEIQNILKNLSKDLILSFEKMCSEILEICNFCSISTDIYNENCKHDKFRCCISEIQIYNLDMKYCKGCGNVAIPDETLLQQVLLDDQDLRCPICDYYLQNVQKHI